ncbi:MAG: hypothetical protein L0210_11810 [Rhodospirillales bacterium]|nr:hypothetical protein [Rhodospirillales bacterium]
MINSDGTRVRLPVRTRQAPVEIDSRKAPGKLTAGEPSKVRPADFDLVVLAMQEPQYRAGEVRELLQTVVHAGVPTLSIMNMPPLPYLARIPGLDAQQFHHCYTDPSVWDGFDPALMTLASPDPQAFRPPEEQPNVLQVTLPTNFKAARFVSEEHSALLRRLERDIEAIRFDPGDGPIELPVKLKVHESVFVPLAKWAMLLTGNYRCVQKDGPRSIRDAVHGDLRASSAVYDWVVSVCVALGASEPDLVPFEKYAAAANALSRPSSVARALFAGAPAIERVDLLVKSIAATKGMRNDIVDQTVALVSDRLEKNRRAQAEFAKRAS